MKFIIFFICVPLVYSRYHRFINTYTEINGQKFAGIPEFSAVSTLDGHQIDYYDSEIKKLIPRQDWMKEFASEELWKNYTEIRERQQQIYRNNIHVLMETFNQSHGLHTYQRMYGCEYDDETRASYGFDQYGYDGEDFISLDLKEDRYITPVAQGVSTVQKWNNDTAQLAFLKQYYNYECVFWLKEFLKFSKEANRTTAPEVSLLQKNPSSPVACHATGFYPSRVSITWLKNELEHDEDVDLGELLPNEDGTFQRTSSIRVSPDEWKKNQFSCVVEHQGKTTQKTDDEIKSNYKLHRFINTYTEINGQKFAGIPEFSAVTTLDGHQIDYYDSEIKKLIPRQDWMKEFASTELWKKYIKIREKQQQIYRNNIHVIMERFNQSHGLHTYQRMYGCEYDDETRASYGFDQYGYDGEDFIALDLKEDRYITPVAQGVSTVQKWNNDTAQFRFLKRYYDHECVYWLKEFLKFSKEANRITAPEVSLLQKNPSSPVACHATGFYPSGVNITWLKNEQDHDEDVDLGELLPNEDGTFQKTSSISVSPDEWKNNQFTCEVYHQGKNTQKTDDEIKSNYRPTQEYMPFCV